MDPTPAAGDGIPAVDLAIALRYVGGDRALLEDLVEVFCAERDARLGALRKAIAVGDAATVRRTAHSLKSVLGILGAASGRTVAAELELIGCSDRLAEAAGVLARLEHELAEVVAFFAAHRGRTGA